MTASSPEPNDLRPAAAAQPPLTLEIISLTGALWSGPVREVSLPGGAGRFGVLARHTPMLCTLREGMVDIHPPGGAEPLQVYVSGGYAEVQPNKVIVLADQAVRSADLDQARAAAARNAAASPMAASLSDPAYAELHKELVQYSELRQRVRASK